MSGYWLSYVLQTLRDTMGACLACKQFDEASAQNPMPVSRMFLIQIRCPFRSGVDPTDPWEILRWRWQTASSSTITFIRMETKIEEERKKRTAQE
jgi:hypothetical protein